MGGGASTIKEPVANNAANVKEEKKAKVVEGPPVGGKSVPGFGSDDDENQDAFL